MRVPLVMLIAAVATSSLRAQPVEKNLVQASIVADVKAGGADESFRVGVLLKIKPGWHIYWINPGDSGAATAVRFKAPDGIQISETRFPVPVKFEQPGELIGYGYEGEVMLSALVTVPPSMRAGETVAISAEAEWLCCEKVCIPGDAKMSVTVPVKLKREEANRDLFDAWEKRLPAAASAFQIKSSGGLMDGKRGEFTLAVDAEEPISKIEFFPAPEEALSVENISASVDGNRGTITFDARVLAGQKLTRDALRGVIAVTSRTGGRSGITVEVPLAARK